LKPRPEKNGRPEVRGSWCRKGSFDSGFPRWTTPASETLAGDPGYQSAREPSLAQDDIENQSQNQSQNRQQVLRSAQDDNRKAKVKVECRSFAPLRMTSIKPKQVLRFAQDDIKKNKTLKGKKIGTPEKFS
jgi:hypothetical protein